MISNALSDPSAYILTTEFEVRGALRSLATEQRLIQLRVPAGHTSVLTTLLHIDPDQSALTFDGTSDPSLLRHILAAEKLHFEASQNGVHISFRTGPAESCLFEERPALRLPLPAELVRVQRRDAFRIATPVGKPALCTIPLPQGAVTLPLEDLSTGGLGASDAAREVPTDIGQIFSDCLLTLPGSDPIPVTLRLVHVREFERAGKQLRNLGLAFEGLRGGALARIQRYISTLEREALARNRGFG